jgi:heme o synthase
MGVAAAIGSIYNVESFYLFTSMYLWQISHFMAISYKCKGDYEAAGYKMLVSSNPELSSFFALFHAILLFPLCWGLPYFGIVPWWFALVTTPINYVIFKPSLDFYYENNTKNATNLFWSSLKHLLLTFTTQIVTFKWDSIVSSSKSIFEWIKSLF